jgi:dihydrofolate reductase
VSPIERHAPEEHVGRLIYSMNVSLDGYIETADHSLDWTVVDEELHCWFTDRAREEQAFLYGRRLYEVMAPYWPNAEKDPTSTDFELDFARMWVPKPKIVFSTSLKSVDWNSRLVHGDVGEIYSELRREFDGDLEVAGPHLAAQFIRRGLVDEYGLVVHPVMLGAGTPYFPKLDSPIRLRLVETRRFANGATYLGYRPM